MRESNDDDDGTTVAIGLDLTDRLELVLILRDLQESSDVNTRRSPIQRPDIQL